MDFIAMPLGKLMLFIHNNLSFGNYGTAIVFFTILTKILLLPLTIKQYQSTARMQKLNPKLEDLRRQYGTDKNKLNEETMKLYQEEKINPMSSCLPLLIQMPILFSLYRVITMPLTYMLGKTADEITQIREIYTRIYESISGVLPRVGQGADMEILNFFKLNPAYMNEVSGLLGQGDLLNMSFLGLDLSKVPTIDPKLLFGAEMSIYLPLLLVPVVGVVSTFISTKLSSASMSTSNQNQQAASMNRTMMMMGPVMTLIFSFQMPAGVLLYWIAGYVIQIVQQLFVNKYIFKIGKVQETPDNGKPSRKTGTEENTGIMESGINSVGEGGVGVLSAQKEAAPRVAAEKTAPPSKAAVKTKEPVKKRITAEDPGAVWNPHLQEFVIPEAAGHSQQEQKNATDGSNEDERSGDSKKKKK